MAQRRSIKREARDLELYRLAASGMSYATIAQRMGVSKTTVHRAVNACAAAQAEDTKAHARDLIEARYLLVVQKHMANLADPRSAEVVLRASEQQARLLGLYTPQQGAGVAEAASMLGALVTGLEEARNASA